MSVSSAIEAEGTLFDAKEIIPNEEQSIKTEAFTHRLSFHFDLLYGIQSELHRVQH